MSSTSRIVFFLFRSAADPMVAAWGRFHDSVADATIDRRSSAAMLARWPEVHTAPDSPFVVWRVLAPNNREIARSSRAYRSFDEAHRHVVEIRQHANDLSITLATGGAGRHGWFFVLEDQVVLTCGRWYGGAAVSVEAALATVDCLRSGSVDMEPHEISPSRRSARVRGR